MRRLGYAAGALLLSLGLAVSAVAEVAKVLISYQPGLSYMPLILAGKNKLIQTHAAAAGVGNLTVDWILSRLRAMTNVASDLLLAVLLDRFEGGPGQVLADKPAPHDPDGI